jgi:hypothetical protein
MRRRRQGNSASQKDHTVEYIVGNEQSEHPVPEPKRMMIKYHQ